MPYPWECILNNRSDIPRAMAFAKKAELHDKQVINFFWSDLDEVVPVHNSVLFRTSLYSSRRRKNEHAMPSWGEDLVERYRNGILPIREKGDRPVVGFCGLDDVPSRLDGPYIYHRVAAWSKRRIKPGSYNDEGHRLRGEAVKLISREPRIVTNFDLKDQFCGGTTSDSSVGTKLKVRNDFVDNMFGSDYILCIKGNGNYSVRFYETMCSGRIPIFLDTDCVLPFDEEINWREHCVWIERKDLHRIAEKVVEFHESLSPSDFIKMQKSCRKLLEGKTFSGRILL